MNDIIQDKSYDPFILIDCRILNIGLTTEAFRTYAELKRYANKEGQCFPSYTRLAKIFKGSYPNGHESTLKKKAIASVKELISWGLLTKEKRPLGDTESPASNIYTLTPPSDWKEFPDLPSDMSHKKRDSKKGGDSQEPPLPSSASALPGSAAEPPLPSSASALPSSASALPSSASALPGSARSTLTRSKELDPLTRSKELDPKERDTPAHTRCSPESRFCQEDFVQAHNAVFQNDSTSPAFIDNPDIQHRPITEQDTDSVLTNLINQDSQALVFVPQRENNNQNQIEDNLTLIRDAMRNGGKVTSFDKDRVAFADLGSELIASYRHSGRVTTTKTGDINPDFALYIAKQYKGKDIDYGYARIKKMESNPDEYQTLASCLTKWQMVIKTGDRSLNLSDQYEKATTPKTRLQLRTEQELKKYREEAGNA